jgi:CPA1 family monovalent cation:H+ antiporter
MLGFEFILLLLIVVLALAPLARALDVPLPVMLVIGGGAMAWIPWVPRVVFDPQLVFLVFVPPLLYWGSLTSSVRDLRRARRAIGMLALGGVVVTVLAVAAVAHAIIPDLPWAPAFVLGAIVSPPDAAVTLAIARRLGIPRRLTAILEGETLFNDVAAFTAYKLAVAATLTGTFTAWQVAPHLLYSGAGGVGIGWLAAKGIVLLRQVVKAPTVSSTLSLLTPFASYLPAEWADTSGVLAVVTTGLVLSRYSPRVPAYARLQAQQMWEVLRFVLDGLIFLMIGLELGRLIDEALHHDEGTAIAHAAVIAGVVIAVRLLWVVPAAVVPRLLRWLRHEHDSMHSWRATAFIAWTGIRGGDTLVTALAVPLVLEDGSPFPGRHEIIMVSFGVILATLVIQGLTLRPLIRLCSFPTDRTDEDEEREARGKLAEAGVARLGEIARNEGLPPEVADQIRVHHHLRRHVRSGSEHQPQNVAASILRAPLLRINKEVLRAEREMIVHLRDRHVIGDNVMLRLQRELDLEEVVMERTLDE